MTLPDMYERTILLLGKENVDRLTHSHVMIVGVGGVGAVAAEMLVRAGVGRITIVDADTVSPSNLNRQLCALNSTVGLPKVEVLRARFSDINPSAQLKAKELFIDADCIDELITSDKYDFIVDAIDTLVPKCTLIARSLLSGIPIVSSMGAGAKRNPSLVRMGDLWQTSYCPLCRAVRSSLRRMNVKAPLPVVYSTEPADPKAVLTVSGERNKKTVVGTVSYMPTIFGCFLSAYVLEQLCAPK